MFLVRMATTRNVGTLDRFVRVVPAIVTAGFWWTGTLSGVPLISVGIISAMLLVTSLTGSCSIYYLLGLSTCPRTNRAP